MFGRVLNASVFRDHSISTETKFFEKLISYPLIHTRTCAYQGKEEGGEEDGGEGVRNVTPFLLL